MSVGDDPGDARGTPSFQFSRETTWCPVLWRGSESGLDAPLTPSSPLSSQKKERCADLGKNYKTFLVLVRSPGVCGRRGLSRGGTRPRPKGAEVAPVRRDLSGLWLGQQKLIKANQSSSSLAWLPFYLPPGVCNLLKHFTFRGLAHLLRH